MLVITVCRSEGLRKDYMSEKCNSTCWEVIDLHRNDYYYYYNINKWSFWCNYEPFSCQQNCRLLNHWKGTAAFDERESSDCSVIKIRSPRGVSVSWDMLVGKWFRMVSVVWERPDKWPSLWPCSHGSLEYNEASERGAVKLTQYRIWVGFLVPEL